MSHDTSIKIILSIQKLQLFESGRLTEFDVSTALKGAGQQQGSFQTPLGRHIIRAKIGANAPSATVFSARRVTGEIYGDDLASLFPHRDWILSRILWLSGLEKGFNRLGEVDTMRRYIYIHGTPDSVPMGVPASHGCIRMRNADVIDLFDRVRVGTQVDIVE